jgi:hypothetical protein
MARARIPDLGRSTFLSHAAVRFRPIRHDRIVLCPVNDAGFVAPVEQFWHRPQMRSAGHVGSHSALVAPDGHGPECSPAVSEQRAAEETARPLCLLPCSKRLDNELRHEPKRADAQSGNADECHRSTSVETLLHSRAHAAMNGRPLLDGDQKQQSDRI